MYNFNLKFLLDIVLFHNINIKIKICLGLATYNETMVWPVVPKYCHLVRGTTSTSNLYEPIRRAYTKRL